jgi:hypothetical protein
MAPGRYVSRYQLAVIHAALGNVDVAFDMLEGAIRERDWNLVLLRVDARVDPLRPSPRFADVQRRAGV